MAYSIQEAKQGGAQMLGPVTIKKVFDPRIVKDGKTMKSCIIEDGSGETKLTLFEPASLQNLVEGASITLKGKVETNEYPKGSGQISLQGSNLAIEGQSVGQSQAPAQAASGPSHGAPSSYDDKQMQIMRQNALGHATALVVACGVNDIFNSQADVLVLAEVFAHFSATGEKPE